MKKAISLTVKIIGGLILLILVLLFTVPVIFKGKIKTEVESVINESVNADVKFADYSLSFFRNFPNLAFSLKGVSVVGKGQFEGDTLAGFGSFDLVFNLGSIFSSSGYEVKSIILDRAVVNAIVLKDGSANWDIAIPSEEPADTVTATEPEESASESSMKLLLKKFEIRNANITYTDEQMNMKAKLGDLNYSLSGNMTLSETDLSMALGISKVTVEMDGIRYLNNAALDSKVGLLANLDSMKFTFGENYFAVNDLRLNFSGSVSMPGDDIATDMKFSTESTSFKTLLSLVPAVYMSGYEELSASGDLQLSGYARGVYSEADSTMPDVNLLLNVDNGIISYPDLPEKITNIGVSLKVNADGKDLDKTTVDLDKFHFELAGNPFDLTFSLKTPMSDPDFKGAANGKIDLASLAKAVPMDSISLKGIIEVGMSMAGRLSMIEKERYEDFSAKGTLTVKGMDVKMSGYPGVLINEVKLLFTPEFTQLQQADIIVEGKSDFSVTGNIENYIPYVFRNETIKGNLSLVSKNIDVASIMNSMATDTAEVEVADDTTALAVIAVPGNIDFEFKAYIAAFSYDNIKASDIKGNIIVRDGVLSIRQTGLSILGGTVTMNADYDTRDTLKPVMKADFDMKNIGIKDAYNTFVTVQKLAPAAKGIEGRIAAKLEFSSLLASDMMPVLQTIEGYGKLQSDQIQLLESKTFDKMKEVLKLGDKYSNTFKDINISFRISEGRVYVNPFDLKMGSIKMNVSGDQGLDQTLNYIIKTEIPRSELGSSVNSLIDNLSSQAAAFGITYKPADVLKVPVKVGGTFSDPVVTPYFGSGGDTKQGGGIKEGVKETVKENVANKVEKGKEQLREEAAAQGDKLVKEAEEQGQRLREEAAKVAARLKMEADSSAAKLVKAAETKGTLARVAATKSGDALKKEADKKGNQLVLEADNQAKKLLEEAKAKREAMINKI